MSSHLGSLCTISRNNRSAVSAAKSAFALLLIWTVSGHAIAQEEEPELCRIVGVAHNDTLNVHSGAGEKEPIVARLRSNTTGIEIDGASIWNGPDEWVPITYSDIGGWVRAKYILRGRQNPELTPDLSLSSQTTRGDATMVAVINDPDGFTFVRAGQTADSAFLGRIVRGERFIATPSTNDWWQVRTSSGVTGFVHRSRIVAAEEEIAKATPSPEPAAVADPYGWVKPAVVIGAILAGAVILDGIANSDAPTKDEADAKYEDTKAAIEYDKQRAREEAERAGDN